jgi:hypothetical protein
LFHPKIVFVTETSPQPLGSSRSKRGT